MAVMWVVHPALFHCHGNGDSDLSVAVRRHGGRCRFCAAEGCGVGEPGAWGEVRPVLVARLLELDAAGALTTAHVRAGAQVGGVNVRTVWRWLEAARTEGRMVRRPRARMELSDQAWVVLAQAGGNVSVLHRHLKDDGGEVPSLASLYRVVRRDLEAGRVLPDRAVARRERVERSCSVRWPYLRVRPGICSTKVRRGHKVFQHRNRRTWSWSTTLRPALGTSAGKRR